MAKRVMSIEDIIKFLRNNYKLTAKFTVTITKEYMVISEKKVMSVIFYPEE